MTATPPLHGRFRRGIDTTRRRISASPDYLRGHRAAGYTLAVIGGALGAGGLVALGERIGLEQLVDSGFSSVTHLWDSLFADASASPVVAPTIPSTASSLLPTASEKVSTYFIGVGSALALARKFYQARFEGPLLALVPGLKDIGIGFFAILPYFIRLGGSYESPRPGMTSEQIATYVYTNQELLHDLKTSLPLVIGFGALGLALGTASRIFRPPSRPT